MNKRLYSGLVLVMIILTILIRYQYDLHYHNVGEKPLIGLRQEGYIVFSAIPSPQERADILSKPIKLTDQEILEELQFLKEIGEISPDKYELLIHMIDNSSAYYNEGYDEFSDIVLTRDDIRHMLQEAQGGSLLHQIGNILLQTKNIPLFVVNENTPDAPPQSHITTEWNDALISAVQERNIKSQALQFSLVTMDSRVPSTDSITVRMSYAVNNCAELHSSLSPQESGLYLRIRQGLHESSLTPEDRKEIIYFFLDAIAGGTISGSIFAYDRSYCSYMP